MNPESSLSSLWKPSASIQALKQRAAIMARIRAFFSERDYFEVETPVMGAHGVTDVYLENIQAHCSGKTYALQTSPEYHMKRLLAAGSGPIFQLARAFRDDEHGRWHNPEFTMLEWYRPGFNHHELLAEVGDFLQVILACEPLVVMSYQEAFMHACQLDPFDTSQAELNLRLQRFDLAGVLSDDETDVDQYLFLLMSHVVEPYLAKYSGPVGLVDFPESQAALACVNNGVAERFEVYYRGVELANGFHELTDASIQAARFEKDLQTRRARGLSMPEPDVYLLDALKHGLPASSGVALGVDRLIALALGHSSIQESLAFDISRA
ncbi:MAG: elongation factor P--(R)-beta-lysine ligase [Legionellaceae bacterium]|nr:elongation factor P--(R)-beta-lysine ligase [Legionellaceae bacterium]